ncbi:MAG: Hsp20/alpha crystallin family protein [Gemmatimonadaceae bacterium]
MVTVTPLNSVFDRMVSLSRTMDQAFSPTPSAPPSARGWTPAVDAVETEQEYLIYFDLPGVTSEKVDVSFEHNTLTVRGQREPNFPQGEGSRVFFSERDWGSFERSLRFPQHVEGDRISARSLRAC